MTHRTPRTDAGRRVTRRAKALVRVVTALVMALTVVAAAVLAGPPSPALAAGFTVYTNERFAHTPGLQQYGAIKATVVYDSAHFTCDANGCYSNGGALPSQATYEAQARTYMSASQFGGEATA